MVQIAGQLRSSSGLWTHRTFDLLHLGHVTFASGGL
jgi:hypothetical protein